MALSEFLAMESAYRALQQLDPAGRQRALRWLTDALSDTDPLPEAPAEDNTPIAAAPAAAESTSESSEETVAEPAAEDSSNGRAEAAVRPARKTRTSRRAASRNGSGTAASANSSSTRNKRGAAGRTRRSRNGAAAAESNGGERVYRRMPPADVVLAAYRQVGTVSGLADHFEVPRHTVQGWARRLRREGYEIGRNAETTG